MHNLEVRPENVEPMTEALENLPDELTRAEVVILLNAILRAYGCEGEDRLRTLLILLDNTEGAQVLDEETVMAMDEKGETTLQ